jgi:hypothetical protein
MNRPKTFLTLALGTTMVIVFALLFATTSSAFASGWGWHSQRDLFVQTNNTTANSIMVYQRAWNGTLTLAGTYSTGGMGGVASGATADPLASQGSLAGADHGRVLLAVNAGSNTVSLFRVRGDRLWLKQVIAAGGTFPVSIAVHRNLVYVLNAGVTPVTTPGASSVQGFWLRGDHLWPIRGSSRAVGPTITTQPFYLASPGMVGFSPDGARLVVATKFSGSLIDVFRVGHWGMLSATPMANPTAPTAAHVPFAFVFDPWGRLVVVQVGDSGISSYAFKPDNSLAFIGAANDTKDAVAASCWISRAGHYCFVSNAGSANISIYRLHYSGMPSLVGAMPTTAAAGTTDSVTTRDGHFLYVECGGAGVVLAYRIHGDGGLSLIQTVTGLPVPFEGIALN